MNKIFKKTVASVLAVVMAVGTLCLTGCDNGGNGGAAQVDKTKTQLFVGILDGGLGDEWANKLKTRFEEAYADYQGVDGKVGVQVIIDKQKEPFRGTTLINNIASNRQDVYFTEQIYYDQWVRKDLMLDITDVAEGSLYKFGEDTTIEDKMFDADKEYLKRDGKYYALPFYSAYQAISYDVDLFDTYGLYFDDNGEFIGTTTDANGMPVPDLSQKSAGQDGVKGTMDDGLPITYAQFFRLCDEMKSMNITPIHWAGGYQNYVTAYLQQLYVDYEGAQQFALSYTPDEGEVTNYIADRDSIGDSLEDVKVTTAPSSEENLNRQAGKYYALKFCETLVNNNYSGALSFSPSESFLTAQETFLYSSRLAGSAGKTPVGMFIDGTWWYNEASSIFADMSDTYPDSGAMDRRIGVMPTPKPTADDVGNNTLLILNDTLVFVNKAIDTSKIELAKDFIRFATTDESLREFTQTTNMMRTYKYELSEEELASLPYFGQSYYAYLQSAELVFPRANNEYYAENLNANMKFEATVNGTLYNVPSQAFKDHADVTAEDYFFGLN